MSEELLTILKFCLLALLYLFFFRVLRAVWAEMRPQLTVERNNLSSAPINPAAPPTPGVSRRQARRLPSQLTVVEPAHQRGRQFPIVAEMTLGRASGCHVAIPEDTFSSQIHARIFQRDGQTWVEDLGSTNGTFVNTKRVTSATSVSRGDQVQVGSTVMELG